MIEYNLWKGNIPSGHRVPQLARISPTPSILDSRIRGGLRCESQGQNYRTQTISNSQVNQTSWKPGNENNMKKFHPVTTL